MQKKLMDELSEEIRDFKLPKYEEIPNVGLFLEQTSKYIAQYMNSLGSINLTTSMISNYVKKGLVDKPIKKQYYREQIGYLMFIAVAKTVLSLEDIQLMVNLRKKTYDSKTAYEYFSEEFENVLFYVFGLKDSIEEVGIDDTDEKIMLRNTIITVAHKIYLDKCFKMLHKNTVDEDESKKPLK